MESIREIKKHYNFFDRDVKNLVRAASVMARYKDEFPIKFYEHIKDFEETSRFLKDADVIKKHQNALKDWFTNLFSGDYEESYLLGLEKVGYAHVKIGLSPHYVNASMNFVRIYCLDVLRKEFKDEAERREIANSLEKIIDINLDIITSSFVEGELKDYFLSQRFESSIIHLVKRFTHGLNLILLTGLMILSVMVMGLFVYDVSHIFDGNIEKGLLSTLGSLLVLWVVIELMNTEIKHLKGGKFAIKVFISVALVSVIRKILIITLRGDEAVATQLTLIAAVAVLGVIYWLLARLEA